MNYVSFVKIIFFKRQINSVIPTMEEGRERERDRERGRSHQNDHKEPPSLDFNTN